MGKVITLARRSKNEANEVLIKADGWLVTRKISARGLECYIAHRDVVDATGNTTRLSSKWYYTDSLYFDGIKQDPTKPRMHFDSKAEKAAHFLKVMDAMQGVDDVRQ